LYNDIWHGIGEGGGSQKRLYKEPKNWKPQTDHSALHQILQVTTLPPMPRTNFCILMTVDKLTTRSTWKIILKWILEKYSGSCEVDASDQG